MEWWVYRDGTVSDRPLAVTELREKEYVTNDTYVCRTDRDSWTRAGDDPELKRIFRDEDDLDEPDDLELDDEESGARPAPAFNVDHTSSETEENPPVDVPEEESTEEPSNETAPGSDFQGQREILATSLWKRPLAFSLDFALFYLLGRLLTASYPEVVSHLHTRGILLGYSVFFLYMAIFNSELGGSGSLGKKLLGLQVKDSEGFSLSFYTSFWRYFLLMLPFVLWSVVFTHLLEDLPDVVHVALVMVAVFFLVSIVYLFLFNEYRRSLHDCVTTTAVVQANIHDILNFTFWRGHFYFIGVFFALSIYGLSVVFAHFGGVVPILSLQKSLLEEREVLAAGVPVYRGFWQETGGQPDTLPVKIWIKDRPEKPEKFQRKIINKIFLQSLLVEDYGRIDLYLGTGMNLGIYRKMNYEEDSRTISEWRYVLD